MRESFSLQISFTNYRSKHVHGNTQNWSSFLFQVNTECINRERQLSKRYSKIWADRLCTVFWMCWRFILTRHRCKTKPSAHNLLTRNCHRATLGRKKSVKAVPGWLLPSNVNSTYGKRVPVFHLVNNVFFKR